MWTLVVVVGVDADESVDGNAVGVVEDVVDERRDEKMKWWAAVVPLPTDVAVAVSHFRSGPTGR